MPYLDSIKPKKGVGPLYGCSLNLIKDGECVFVSFAFNKPYIAIAGHAPLPANRRHLVDSVNGMILAVVDLNYPNNSYSMHDLYGVTSTTNGVHKPRVIKYCGGSYLVTKLAIRGPDVGPIAPVQVAMYIKKQRKLASTLSALGDSDGTVSMLRSSANGMAKALRAHNKLWPDKTYLLGA